MSSWGSDVKSVCRTSRGFCSSVAVMQGCCSNREVTVKSMPLPAIVWQWAWQCGGHCVLHRLLVHGMTSSRKMNAISGEQWLAAAAAEKLSVLSPEPNSAGVLRAPTAGDAVGGTRSLCHTIWNDERETVLSPTSISLRMALSTWKMHNCTEICVHACTHLFHY